MLSAIIITHNEELDLPGCLDSLKGLAQEVVVVDSGSTDRTREVATACGARVFHRDWPGYGPQKQFALEQATGEWVINVDADERVTPALAEEIKRILSQEALPNGYSIPFRLFFLERRLRFCRWGKEFHVRLFRRDKASYPGQAVHEGISVLPPLGRLKNCIDHHSTRSFSEYLKKCEEYTALLAGQKRAKGVRFSAWMHLRLPWEFFVRYVLKGGFLDGNVGLVYAVLSATYAWLKHVRLLEERE